MIILTVSLELYIVAPNSFAYLFTASKQAHHLYLFHVSLFRKAETTSFLCYHSTESVLLTPIIFVLFSPLCHSYKTQLTTALSTFWTISEFPFLFVTSFTLLVCLVPFLVSVYAPLKSFSTLILPELNQLPDTNSR